MITKRCSKCKCDKSIDDFYSKGSSGKTQTFCKVCFNAYCIERWRKRKFEVIAHFQDKCNDCKNTFHYSIYEFHHLVPSEKEYSWNKLRLFSNDKMQKELQKCVMLCANCHRLRHYDD